MRDSVTIDLADVRGSAQTLAGHGPYQGVIAVDERSARLAAEVADLAAEQPYHSPDGARAALDKRRMRRVLQEAGLPTPRHAVFGPDATPNADVAGFPCVVKPPMLSGSQGVIRADDRDELVRAVHRVRQILARHPSEQRATEGFFDVIVEEFIAGPEMAVEGIMNRGKLQTLAVFDKPEAGDGPFFEETIYVTSELNAGAAGRIDDAVQAYARALGLVHGPIHAEMRARDGDLVLIEMAGRSIGGFCSAVFAPLIGSLERRLLRFAAGLDAEPVPASRGAAAVMMIPIPQSGVLKAVTGVERARSVRGIEDVVVSASPGQSVRALPEGNAYLGFVFARTASRDEAVTQLRRAHACLSFDFKRLLS